MTASKKDALGKAIAEALDLDVDAVRKITLTCEAGAPDKVEVEYTRVSLDAKEIVSEIRNYVLQDVS